MATIAPRIQAIYRPAAGDIRVIAPNGETTDLSIEDAEDLRDALDAALKLREHAAALIDGAITAGLFAAR